MPFLYTYLKMRPRSTVPLNDSINNNIIDSSQICGSLYTVDEKLINNFLLCLHKQQAMWRFSSILQLTYGCGWVVIAVHLVKLQPPMLSGPNPPNYPIINRRSRARRKTYNSESFHPPNWMSSQYCWIVVELSTLRPYAISCNFTDATPSTPQSHQGFY